MNINGEEWMQSEDGMRYVRKENKMKTKEEYVVERYRAIKPATTARFESEYEERYKPWNPPKSESMDGKIDWTKPLICNNSVVTNIEYIQRVNINPLGFVHVCRLTYKQGYTYYTMYTDEGRTVGNNAGTINVKNKVESWGRSAWMVLGKSGDLLSMKWRTKEDALEWAQRHHMHKLGELQFVRYDYTETR